MGVTPGTTVCCHGGLWLPGARVSDSESSLDPSGVPAGFGTRGSEERTMSRQDVKDEVIYLRSAGVDLGKRFLLACVRTPRTARAETWSLETERFGTTRRSWGGCWPG
jgi:hypothetical protein